jgi:hypothetical protein
MLVSLHRATTVLPDLCDQSGLQGLGFALGGDDEIVARGPAIHQ